jgi:hypothetical protein
MSRFGAQLRTLKDYSIHDSVSEERTESSRMVRFQKKESTKRFKQGHLMPPEVELGRAVWE